MSFPRALMHIQASGDTSGLLYELPVAAVTGEAQLSLMAPEATIPSNRNKALAGLWSPRGL